jgi:hypothetical protein
VGHGTRQRRKRGGRGAAAGRASGGARMRERRSRITAGWREQRRTREGGPVGEEAGEWCADMRPERGRHLSPHRVPLRLVIGERNPPKNEPSHATAPSLPRRGRTPLTPQPRPSSVLPLAAVDTATVRPEARQAASTNTPRALSLELNLLPPVSTAPSFLSSVSTIQSPPCSCSFRT